MAKEKEAFWINVDAFNRNKAGAEAGGVYMDLLVYVWRPTMEPFRFDPETLATRLNVVLPRREYTAEKLEALRPAIATFFVVLDDGRWAPSPEYLSMTDGNPGGRVI